MSNRPTAPKDAKPGRAPKADAPLGDAAPVAFLDLQAHHCRWPVGEVVEGHHEFCGRKRAHGKPYCEAHCARAYTAQSQTQRNTA